MSFYNAEYQYCDRRKTRVCGSQRKGGKREGGQVTEGPLEEKTSQLGVVDESKLVRWL